MNEASQDDAERKQVTVLFADVSGSMDLAEQEDPEEWRKIMQRFFSLLAETVTRFEGTVDKFTGDGIMAIFGAPVAHEDHARRACYAALQMLDDVAEYAGELRRARGLNFSTRIGINSGEVVAGAIGAGEGSYTAIGHTVGLAQRMEQLAEPGKAYLTEHTAELARGYLDLNDLGEFEIKGASRPLEVFELAGVGEARGRLDLARERGFSRFVGRERELAKLEGALRRAQEGEATAVGVVAEPGIGKSRLYHEFVARCRSEGTEVFEAQGQAHGKSIPFMPILQMLRAFFGIGDNEPELLAREKIAGRALLLDAAFAEDLPLLFDFLGVPDPERPVPQMSPEARQRALAEVLCRLVGNPARKKTLLLVFEDLHWIDEGSQTMLNGLIAGFGGTRTLVLANYRPEYAPPWEGDASWSQIELAPLRQEDTRELLRDLTGEDPSLDGLDEPIHERTGGNPFFIEEVVRELSESGYLEGERGAYRLVRPIEGAGVPVTVQAVLAARIDRLGAEAKQLLQVASVLGKEVSAEALGVAAGLDEEEMEASLGELTDGGFLYEAELYPQRLLAFRHPLTREVAYGTQLAEQRARTHAAAARALIRLNPPDRWDELSALIADHLRQGGERLEAARWSARAAYWAGHSRPRESLRLWHDVMELTDGLEEDEEVAALAIHSRLQQLTYAFRVGLGREEQERLAAEAEEIATRRDDLHSLALLRVATAVRPGLDHYAESWIAAVRESVELADRAGDPHLRVAIRCAGAFAYLMTGDFDGFEKALDEVLEMVGEDGSIGANIILGSPTAWGLMGKGMVRREKVEFDAAEELFERALRIALEEDDPETASWIRSNQAGLLAMRGDSEAGLAIARRNVELTDKLGDVFSRSLALSNLSWAQLNSGDAEGALEAIEESERLYRETMEGGGEMATWRAHLRSQALREVGRLEEAVEAAEWAAETSRSRGLLWTYPAAMLALTRALRAAGRPGAMEALAEAERVAVETGAETLMIDIAAEREALGDGGGGLGVRTRGAY
ncbi:MAG TPA: adenylate/guanylate cyclase domain-containing protein [Solirubrobacterales bacterium]|nr:adenylate/guanylate cyclase domain-containing protein [Solirubrobacterales bacterium]